jgi:hypothetical protein
MKRRFALRAAVLVVAALAGCGLYDGNILQIVNVVPDGALGINFTVNMGSVVDAFAARNGLALYDKQYVSSADSTVYSFRIDRTVVPNSVSHRAMAVQLVQAFPDTIRFITVTPPGSKNMTQPTERIGRGQ